MHVQTTALASLIVGLTACSQGQGGIVDGSLVVRECHKVDSVARFEPFNLSFGFMALERDEDVVIMRFHPEATWMPDHDSLTVTVEDYSVIRAEIETVGETSRDQTHGIRAGLVLKKTCPASTAAMVARNLDITFRALSVNGGERVNFSMFFDLFDERTGEQVGAGLVAEVDFEVALGTPYQQFSDPSAQRH